MNTKTTYVIKHSDNRRSANLLAADGSWTHDEDAAQVFTVYAEAKARIAEIGFNSTINHGERNAFVLPRYF